MGFFFLGGGGVKLSTRWLVVLDSLWRTTKCSHVRRHEQTIQTMCSSMDKLRREKRELEERVTELKWRSMKNNLIFHGLEGESRQEDVQSKLRSFIRQELGIDRFIEFGNVHRFSRHTRNKPRPIVAKFIYYQDRALVLENSYKLRNSQWRIYEQFPVAMEERRKQLQPVARDFRANGHHTEFVRDKLFIDGVLYDEEDCEQWLETPSQGDAEETEEMDYDNAHSNSGPGQGFDLR